MLSPTKRKSIIRSGELKAQVANDRSKVEANVTNTAQKAGAAPDEIEDILKELGSILRGRGL